MLTGHNILVGVTGGIACYKTCEIVSRLKKLGAGVDVIMTKNATEFVSPLTFETLSARPVVADTFARPKTWEVEHISLAKKADLCLIAPATANFIAKLAQGIADDMLSTTMLALKCPTIIAPSMNTNMYDNIAVQDNIKILKARGIIVLDTNFGSLACGDIGRGRMAEPVEIVSKIEKTLNITQDFLGKTVLVTAGATRENIDGIRFITNRSSGKMGIEIAKAITSRGGQVVLVAGLVSIDLPSPIFKIVRVETTEQMMSAVKENLGECDIIVKAAAPSDYRIKKDYANKLKDDNLTLELVKNPDIAQYVGSVKGNKKLVIFCAETQDLLQSAQSKLVKKNADMVIANDVTQKGAGFDCDTNIVTIIKKDGTAKAFEIMQKSALAQIVADEILTL